MPKQTIHICHVVQRLATGGLENGVVNLINKLPYGEFFHSVVCISDSDPNFVARILRDDVVVYHLNKAPGRSIGYLFELRKIIKQLMPDIVHSRNLSTLESQVSSIGLDVFRVHGEHGWDGPGARYNKKHQIIRVLLRPVVDQYVVLSNEAYHYLREKIFIEPTIINHICNGVDRDKFYFRKKQPTEIVKIFSVGRLARVKNYPLLIDAVAKLVFERGYRNISLTIIGEGAMREQLISQIARLKLEQYCSLPGDRSDIPEILNSCDIFVLPSTAEGISNTILEAMSTGTAVIATDVGGNSELVDHLRTGMIIPSDNLTALVDALSEYVERPDLRLEHGENGRERIDNLFSIELMVEQYAKVYRSLIN